MIFWYIMVSYPQPTLDQENLNVILIHVGNNNATAKRKATTDAAVSIISVGRKCKDTGINYFQYYAQK